LSPALQLDALIGLDGLDWHVLVSVERTNNGRAIREVGARLRRRREEALEQCNGGIANDTLLASVVDADLDLAIIDQIWADTVDKVRRVGVEVVAAKEGAKLELLRLKREE
jgi:hypothetical protein